MEAPFGAYVVVGSGVLSPIQRRPLCDSTPDSEAAVMSCPSPSSQITGERTGAQPTALNEPERGHEKVSRATGVRLSLGSGSSRAATLYRCLVQGIPAPIGNQVGTSPSIRNTTTPEGGPLATLLPLTHGGLIGVGLPSDSPRTLRSSAQHLARCDARGLERCRGLRETEP
jgi:hypothetical protein